jgi:hypothetical protein
VTQFEAPCAAVVLDAWDRFVTGIACSADADVIDLAEHLLSDPRWIGESVRVVYIETRRRAVPDLRDLARWHDLVARHVDRGPRVLDWMLVAEHTGRVCSMAKRFGSGVDERVEA